MRVIVFRLLFCLVLGLPGMSQAQGTTWVQIEAQPSLTAATGRARAYSGQMENVGGFALSTGWYAIALGPFTPDGAARTLDRLRASGAIPRDSFVVEGSEFRQQFWPLGLNQATRPTAVVPEATVETAVPEPADETPRQARASEAKLSREERMLLQTALKWEGFYDAAIDGAFGRGTRGAMSAYQTARGFELTGVLTTKQRARLIGDYNAVLEGLDLAPITDETAGITIEMPRKLVQFESYKYPFARYSEKDGSGVQVLLISQSGGRETLAGLFDLMQTLTIVPRDGSREAKADNFVLTGQNASINSYTYAAHNAGEIKGFTLVWPAGDDRRLSRVIEAMRASFLPLPGTVLDESLGVAAEEQRIDLLAGLEIRTPDLSRTGFFVDTGGTVVTAHEVVAACSRITIGEDYEVDVVASDALLGLAVVRPREALSPGAHAFFRQSVPRLQSEIAVAGYSYGGVLGAPSLTYGLLSDIRGLRGETELSRLALSALPGDAGGPVLDSAGAVLGMLLPKQETGSRKLPDEVSFAANAGAIGTLLAANGVDASMAVESGSIAPEDLTGLAADMTVLVSCWG